MKQPQDYAKRILLAVSGMSPQIITETLYGLAVQSQPPFVPTEIHIISTREGVKQARLQLLHPETGKFHQFCKDYRLSGIQFPEQNIYVIEDAEGQPLDDIKTPEQNEAAADFITHIVGNLTRDDTAALHVSIAGGRKTMGYYLGYALSLYGRAQDRLSHVLVSDRYESLKDFFYPTPDSQVIFDRDNRSLDAKDARVMLANIPFVRLRGGLPADLLEGRAGFNDSVNRVKKLEAQTLLQINRQQRRILAGGVHIPLAEVNYVCYLWLLERSLANRPVKRPPEVEPNRVDGEEFMRFYQQNQKADKDDERTRDTLKDGMTSKWLSERVTAIKKAFEKQLGQAAKPYLIQSAGRNNRKYYHLTLTGEQVAGLD